MLFAKNHHVWSNCDHLQSECCVYCRTLAILDPPIENHNHLSINDMREQPFIHGGAHTKNPMRDNTNGEESQYCDGDIPSHKISNQNPPEDGLNNIRHRHIGESIAMDSFSGDTQYFFVFA